ncbi:MAG: hypothetical protein ACYDHZ_00770 [Dehalococcoidia bacterium]
MPGASPYFHQDYIFHHQHETQKVAPSGVGPVVLTSGAGAWNLGAFSADIIAAGFTAFPFDIHWLVSATLSANGWYEVVLYYGLADTELCRVAFARNNATTRSISDPLMCSIIPAGSRVRAKMMNDSGGATAEIKVLYHLYDF